MARKPLIEPGSVLPQTDMLSRIVARDRATSGRAPQVEEAPVLDPSPTPSGNPDENITSNITAHTRSNAEAHNEIFAEGKITSHIPAKPARQKDARPDAKSASREESRAAAQQQAHLLGQSRPIPITLRLPEALNDWLDEYAHSHRKQGIKKQDLIARAVQLLVVELSAEDGSEKGGKA